MFAVAGTTDTLSCAPPSPHLVIPNLECFFIEASTVRTAEVDRTCPVLAITSSQERRLGPGRETGKTVHEELGSIWVATSPSVPLASELWLGRTSQGHC